MNPFRSLREYELYIYTLTRQFPTIQRSTLVLVRRGRRLAVLRGELIFADGYRLTVSERLAMDSDEVGIEFYGYEIWYSTEKIAWYDPQPHPNDPTLASTHPHHKHIPPDIKHHRVPAPGLSFEQPNLPLLVREIEALIAQRSPNQTNSTETHEEPKNK